MCSAGDRDFEELPRPDGSKVGKGGAQFQIFAFECDRSSSPCKLE